MSVYVQIYDNDGAFTIYQITEFVAVNGENSNLESIMNRLLARDPRFSSNQILNEGSYLGSINEIQSLTSLLNEQSLKDTLALMSTPIFPKKYGVPQDYSYIKPVKGR